MKKEILLIFLLAIPIVVTAYTTVGTNTGRVVSTGITISNQNLGDMVANSSYYYYRNGSATSYVTDGIAATDIVPFASIDFALDSGYVEVSTGANNTLPNTTKLLIDDDIIPNGNSLVDQNQIQITGEVGVATITYSGANGDNRIIYDSDGDVYVFVNTGEATKGDITIDITLTAT